MEFRDLLKEGDVAIVEIGGDCDFAASIEVELVDVFMGSGRLGDFLLGGRRAFLPLQLH